MVNRLPWKKTRFSQLVADHLNSPKRGGSLVVETGFPTSLIDLIVKNRDRMKNKKASKKKRHDRSSNLMPSSSPSFSPSPPSSTLPSRSPDSFGVSSNSGVAVTECSVPKWSPCSSIREGCEVGSEDLNEVSVSGSDFVEAADGNRILVTVMKVSLVMILALATKKFVVGITASAILLIFFEYVGKHFCRSPKRSENSKITKDSLIQRILVFLKIKRKKLISEEYIRDWKSPITQEKNLILGSSDLICNSESRIPSPEIQVAETESKFRPTIAEIINGTDEEEEGRSKRVEVKKKKKKGALEKEKPYGIEGIELKTRRSKSERIKSKIKKLVSKKHRKSKKEGESKTEATSSIGQDEVELRSEDQELKEVEEEEEEESSLEQDVENILTSSSDVTTTKANVEEAITTREGLGIRTDKRNSGYLILFLIVLSGLVGGRILALLITISGCFVMKSAGVLSRYLKVSMTESPEKKL